MAGKASIVTGGAQGIGKAFAGVLLEDGYKVSVSVYYQPPTNLLEGSVFSHVCLFIGRSHVIIAHVALDFTIQGPLPPAPDIGHHCTGIPPAPPPASDTWWPRLVKLVHLRTPS